MQLKIEASYVWQHCIFYNADEFKLMDERRRVIQESCLYGKPPSQAIKIK